MGSNNGLKIMMFLFIIIFVLSLSAHAFHPCNCRKDRVIKIEYPSMAGRDVKVLQEKLFEFGYYKGPVDGKYDKQVQSAIIDFQQVHQLKVDGIVGPVTWDMLGTVAETVIDTGKTEKPRGKLLIEINLYQRTLTVLADGEPYKVYPVTIGKTETSSPVGEWMIKNKYKRISGGPLGTRWLGLNVPWGVYGIHGTNKPWEIGRATSQGCIRLHNKHVEELFEWVPIKTRVKIIGKRRKIEIKRILKPGYSGREIIELQKRLRKVGYYSGYLDASYGNLTENAVKRLESQFGLKVDGTADWNVIQILN